MPRRIRGALVGVVLLCLMAIPGPAGATRVVPLALDALAVDADVVVVGRVVGLESRWDDQQTQIHTYVSLAVDEVWKGDVPGDTLTIRQVGGRLGGVRAWIFGSPEFHRGEKVLLFLRQTLDGALRVAHLYQGKFTVVTDDETGQEVAYRQAAGPGVEVLTPPGVDPEPETHWLWSARDRVLAHSTTARRPGPPRATGKAPAAVTATPSAAETQAAFTLLGQSRWFEPDQGLPVTISSNSQGEPAAPGLGFNQVRDALAAWSGVPGSSFSYADGGFTSAVGFQLDGVNAVSFRDPLNQIDPPSNCGGTLAIGGFFSSGETVEVNGITFDRIIEGDVVVADGWAACGWFYQDYENFAEVLTHELGHALGLGHSSDQNATMAAFAHFDGRGAALTDDDRAGLVFIYPGSSDPILQVTRTGSGTGTVASDPAGIDCGSTCSAMYASDTLVTLTATPAGTSLFTGWTGACTGSGACAVTMSGAKSVTASFELPTNLQFSAAAYTVGEGTSSATVIVTRTGNTAGSATIGYATSPGTAIPGTDYTHVAGTLAFAAGVTSRTFTVPILNDTLADGNRTVNLTLSGPGGGASLGTPATAVLTIADNDVAGTVQFSAATYSVSEGSGATTITVRRSGGSASGVTVEYATSPGTAIPGTDYTHVAGTLAFAAGVTSRTFTVPILNDTLADGNRTVNLTLSGPGGGASLGTPATAVLTITDNDVAGTVQFSAATYSASEGSGATTITVTRSGGSASGVTVEYATSPGTAIPGTDYTHVAGTLTFGAGETSKTFAVPVVDTPSTDGDRTVMLTLGEPGGGAGLGTPLAATLTILDNEMSVRFSAPTYAVAEGTSKASVTVARSGPTTTTVTVAYATSLGTAIPGTDYQDVAGTLTFTAGTTSRTFTVPILNDTLADGNRTVNLTLSGPGGGASLGTPATAVLTITDNDVAGTVQFSAATYSVSEGSTVAKITVKRTGGKASGVTVEYATSPGTAIPGTDYTHVAGTLAFAAGVTSRTFTVPILNDTLADGNGTVNLTLSAPGGGASLGSTPTAILTIVDND